MIILLAYIIGLIWTYIFCENLIYFYEKTGDEYDIAENTRKGKWFLIILWPLFVAGLVFGKILYLFRGIELPKWIKNKLDRER